MAAHLLVLYNEPKDQAAFESYYRSTHVPIANKIPGIRSYKINNGAIAAAQGKAPYFLVADLEFDSMQALQGGLASPEGQAAAADVPNFATGGVTMLMYESENV